MGNLRAICLIFAIYYTRGAIDTSETPLLESQKEGKNTLNIGALIAEVNEIPIILPETIDHYNISYRMVNYIRDIFKIKYKIITNLRCNNTKDSLPYIEKLKKLAKYPGYFSYVEVYIFLMRIKDVHTTDNIPEEYKTYISISNHFREIRHKIYDREDSYLSDIYQLPTERFIWILTLLITVLDINKSWKAKEANIMRIVLIVDYIWISFTRNLHKRIGVVKTKTVELLHLNNILWEFTLQKSPSFIPIVKLINKITWPKSYYRHSKSVYSPEAKYLGTICDLIIGNSWIHSNLITLWGEEYLMLSKVYKSLVDIGLIILNNKGSLNKLEYRKNLLEDAILKIHSIVFVHFSNRFRNVYTKKPIIIFLIYLNILFTNCRCISYDDFRACNLTLKLFCSSLERLVNKFTKKEEYSAMYDVVQLLYQEIYKLDKDIMKTFFNDIIRLMTTECSSLYSDPQNIYIPNAIIAYIDISNYFRNTLCTISKAERNKFEAYFYDVAEIVNELIYNTQSSDLAALYPIFSAIIGKLYMLSDLIVKGNTADEEWKYKISAKCQQFTFCLFMQLNQLPELSINDIVAYLIKIYKHKDINDIEYLDNDVTKAMARYQLFVELLFQICSDEDFFDCANINSEFHEIVYNILYETVDMAKNIQGNEESVINFILKKIYLVVDQNKLDAKMKCNLMVLGLNLYFTDADSSGDVASACFQYASDHDVQPIQVFLENYLAKMRGYEESGDMPEDTRGVFMEMLGEFDKLLVVNYKNLIDISKIDVYELQSSGDDDTCVICSHDIVSVYATMKNCRCKGLMYHVNCLYTYIYHETMNGNTGRERCPTCRVSIAENDEV